ncbi:gliding motility-associated C-terminal domain-containing protein, partial [Spirosoma harenae]
STVSNGAIWKHIDSLHVGASEQIVFTARLTVKNQAVVNTAEVVYLDNKDTNWSNNSSGVTVTDTSAHTASRIGIAKSVLGQPVAEGDSIIKVTYKFVVSNLGDDTLKKVQVSDDLAYAFRPHTVSSAMVTLSGPGSSLKLNNAFTGTGSNTNLLDSASYIAPNQSQSLNLYVTIRRMAGDSSQTFYNTASVSAINSLTTVSDLSTSGGDVDPDNDGDPSNNSQPTPISLNSLSSGSYIGLAMAVADTVRQSDGSYNVTYQLVVKAYGPDPLKNVMITDSLSKVFNAQTGASLKLVGAPTITSTGSALKVNPNFNGDADPVIILGDSTSQLATGKVDTIRIVINVMSDGSTTTFLNSAYAQATAPTGVVSDVSTSGLNPDLNGNGNPTDSNERETTPLTLEPLYNSIFIPQGFSPNGDGINDLFVIRGTGGLTVSLKVFNRWGNMVYKNDDYRNDWDGKANTGIQISSTDSVGVPDGTYYYMVTLSDGRKFVRYMTINR